MRKVVCKHPGLVVVALLNADQIFEWGSVFAKPRTASVVTPIASEI